MENLPTPLTRVELYLAKIAGMDVTIPERPENRIETFLAVLAGDASVEMPTPHSLVEQWLECVYYGTTTNYPAVEGAMLMGNQKVDTRYFAVASGVPGITLPPAPQNRKEEYWAVIATAGPIHGVLKYVTGSNIVLTDVVRGIESLDRFNGDTTQQTYSGKNLIKLTGNTSSGVTGTINSDGSITISGKATATVGVSVAVLDGTLAAGTYTLTISEAQTSVVNFNMTGAAFRLTAGETSITKTLSSGVSSATLFFAVTNGVTYNTTFKIQLVTGSTPDYDFEPYVGGTPSPNPDYPQDVNVVTGRQVVMVSDGDSQSQEYEVNLGKNLFDYSYMSMAHHGFSATTGAISGSSTNRLVSENLLKLDKGTYTLSFDTVNSCWIMAYDLSGNYLGRQYIQDAWDDTNNKTFVLDRDAQIRVCLRYSDNSVVEVKDYNIQVEKGSAATSYALYFTPIELCKIGNYQDYIYKSGESWYLHKAVRRLSLAIADMDNSDSYPGWIKQTQLKSDLGTSSGGQIYTDTSMITNIAGLVTTDSRSVTKNFNDNNATLLLPKGYYGDGFTQTYWKANYPNLMVNFYYGINGTITDTKITNTALIEQLDALDSAVLPKPNANIVVSGDIAGSLEISYYGRAE